MNHISSNKMSDCAVIIVTHNSEIYLKKCLASLHNQTVPPAQIIIIDSGSTSSEKINCNKDQNNICIYISRSNVGFCKGNNIGLSLVKQEIKYVLFLNPDAFLFSDFIENATKYLEKSDQANTAVISGLLMGYDIMKDCPTGKIDSSGIFRKWYGNWYDRDHGQTYQNQYSKEEESVPALCGALMFCRKEALNTVLLSPNEVWDNSFFMYKDDIDLSLRLRKKNWELKFLPQLTAYHCRGWQPNRQKVSKHFRLLSAKNEIKLFNRMHSPCVLYSWIKYLSVKLFNR